MSESHPARGAWIEILWFHQSDYLLQSHPARGAWIEISSYIIAKHSDLTSHPARGAWIEIRMEPSRFAKVTGRIPQGVRGLK